MHGEDGSKSNTWLIYFGKGGLRSTCHNCKNDRNGQRSSRILFHNIILVVDDSAPRNSWITGKITEVIADRRGLVRQVWIKTQTNRICRPVTKICLLQESAESSLYCVLPCMCNVYVIITVY